MKITLIHGKYFNSWEALGLGYIGAYINKIYPNIQINFFQGCFDSNENIVKEAITSDIIGFSCNTPNFSYCVDLATIFKKENKKIHIVMGGYHPSAEPFSSIKSDVIDQIVVGEGETGFIDIIKGNRKKILHSARSDFCNLPWPNRELIKNNRNIEIAFKDNNKRITSFQCHRACPFQCKYCLDGANKVLYNTGAKTPIEYRNIDDLLNEIEYVTEKYNLDLIKFTDPTWNTNKQWVIDFCKRKIERKINIEFYPNIHAGLLTQEITDYMKQANCYEIAIGIESGSPKILKQIGKGTSINSIKKAVKYAKQSNILIRGYFILGMPDETNEDIHLTDILAEELSIDEYGFTILCPYPGTTMYNSLIHKNIKWEYTDEYSNDFWRTNHISNQELKNWQNYLVEKYKNNICWHNKVINNAYN